MTYVQFFGDSYLLAWCSLWLFWGIIPIVVTVFTFVLKILNRILRSINIAIRGWPPEHLDADGDQVEDEPEVEAKGKWRTPNDS